MHSDGLPRRCAFRGPSTRFAGKHGELSIRPLFRAQAFASLATQLIFNDSALVPARRSPPALSFTSRSSFCSKAARIPIRARRLSRADPPFRAFASRPQHKTC